ncbi:hypothetical protein Ptr902_10654 [Pyrenophora tritici-repentis]|nr:hypothetical protein Ptr902_10654 [Pyrenophora tritici-repentis]
MSSWEISQIRSTSASEFDDSSIYTPTTTTENVPTGLVEGHDVRSRVPTHGSTYIIRAVSSENVMTLLDGQVILAPIGSRGCIYWTCVETEGWLGFRSCSSKKFICYDWHARLKCTAEQKDGHRQFTITPVPKGGYIMQMLDWWRLRPIVLNPENGAQKLARTGDMLSDGIVWEFIKAEEGSAMG